MFAKKTVPLSFAILFALSVPARADWVYDTLNFTNNYNAAGCSGVYTGMRCRESNRSPQPTPQQLEIRSRIERQRNAVLAVTDKALAGIDDVLSRSSEILQPFEPLPEPEAVPSASNQNLICLRSNISSLLLLQEHRLIFGEMGVWRDGTLGKNSHKFIDIYANIYTRRHAQALYRNASLVLGGTSNMLDDAYMERMQRLILSQITPSLRQMAFLSDKYPLWISQNSAPIYLLETMLSVGLRIGFFKERTKKTNYPFLNIDCSAAYARLSHYDKMMEIVDAALEQLDEHGTSAKGIPFADLLPNALRDDLLRPPSVGSIDWLLANGDSHGMYVDWLGVRVISLDDVVGHVPSANSHGIVVLSVYPGSLADRNGIKPGSLIWNIKPISGELRAPSGIVIYSAEDLIQALNQDYTVLGFEFPMRMVREKRSKQVRLELN